MLYFQKAFHYYSFTKHSSFIISNNMLLRNSLSQTKKFFQTTTESFKSFLSNGYTNLPKSPPFHCTFNPFSCTGCGGSDVEFRHSYRELDSFYAAYTNNHRHAAAANDITTVTNSTPMTETPRLENQESIGSTNVTLFREDQKNRKGKGKLGKEEEEERMSVVKLRELEMMDRGNVEHVLDIEEIFHYYSRLTCPTYRAIVDKFFAEMYSELSSTQAADLGGVNVPRRRPQSIKV